MEKKARVAYNFILIFEKFSVSIHLVKMQLFGEFKGLIGNQIIWEEQ